MITLPLDRATDISALLIFFNGLHKDSDFTRTITNFN